MCSMEENQSYGSGTTWGWVSDDRMLIFGWTIPLMMEFAVCTYTSFPAALCLWLFYYSGYSCLLWSLHSSPPSASRTWAMHIHTTKPLPVSPRRFFLSSASFFPPFHFSLLPKGCTNSHEIMPNPSHISHHNQKEK